MPGRYGSCTGATYRKCCTAVYVLSFRDPQEAAAVPGWSVHPRNLVLDRRRGSVSRLRARPVRIVFPGIPMSPASLVSARTIESGAPARGGVRRGAAGRLFTNRKMQNAGNRGKTDSRQCSSGSGTRGSHPDSRAAPAAAGRKTRRRVMCSWAMRVSHCGGGSSGDGS